MTNLDSIFKSRDITLPTKVRLVKQPSSHIYFLKSSVIHNIDHLNSANIHLNTIIVYHIMVLSSNLVSEYTWNYLIYFFSDDSLSAPSMEGVSLVIILSLVYNSLTRKM